MVVELNFIFLKKFLFWFQVSYGIFWKYKVNKHCISNTSIESNALSILLLFNNNNTFQCTDGKISERNNQ